ncbi:MAG: response regulator [Anaerolineae bacterium]|nr:response regulator [Anaerolineae bacterium]
MPRKSVSPTSTATMLVVEDDPASWDILLHLLRYEGIHADAARTAEEALEFAAQYQYDLAVIDLALPGMDGWQLLKALQEDTRTAQLRMVALTAYYDPQIAQLALQRGFLACYPKPASRGLVTELKALATDAD